MLEALPSFIGIRPPIVETFALYLFGQDPGEVVEHQPQFPGDGAISPESLVGHDGRLMLDELLAQFEPPGPTPLTGPVAVSIF